MSRELDAKVDKFIFGRDRFLEQETRGGITLPVELKIPEYITDPAADYLVLKHVRQTWSDWDLIDKFASNLKFTWADRRKAGFSFVTAYEPGDYSRAALKALGELEQSGASN